MSIFVAVGGANDIVESGLRAILSEDPDLVVMEGYQDHGKPPDVVLYDALGIEKDGGAELKQLVDEYDSAFLVVGRDLSPDLAALAVAQGAGGVVSLKMEAAGILAAVRLAALGEVDDDAASESDVALAAGLTGREMEVLGGVARGLSNNEIADEFHLSINSIKSYIRSAYRKIEVTSRSQAVAWCAQHAFEL